MNFFCLNQFQFNYQLQIETATETCAICRNRFDQRCLDCLANAPNDGMLKVPPAVTNVYCKRFLNVFWCLRFSFSKDVTKLIMRYVTLEDELIRTCPVVKGVCKHVFHEDCIYKWTRKRKECPLCNESWVEDETNVITKVLIKKRKINPEGTKK